MSENTLLQNAHVFAQSVCQVFMDMLGQEFAVREETLAEQTFRPRYKMTAMIHFTGSIQGEYSVSLDEEMAARMIGCWSEGMDAEALREMRGDYGGFLKEALNASVGMAIQNLEKDFEALTFLPSTIIYGELDYPLVPSGAVTIAGEAGEAECSFVLNMMGLELGERLQATLKELQGSVQEAASAKRNIQSMLAAFPAGLVSTNRTGVVLPGHSHCTARSVGLAETESLSGMPILELLGYPGREGDLEKDFQLWLEVTFAKYRQLGFKSLLDLCPLEERVNDRGRILLLSWIPIESDNRELEGLLLIIDDVTEKRKIETEMKRLSRQHEQNVELLTQLVNLEPDEVTEFIYDSSGLLSEAEKIIRTAQRNNEFIDSLYRTVHTLKGNSGQFQFKGLQKLAFEIENELSQLRKASEFEDPKALESNKIEHIAEALQEADAYINRLEELRNKLGSREETLKSKAARTEPAILVPLHEIDAITAMSSGICESGRMLNWNPILLGQLSRLTSAAAQLRELRLSYFANSLAGVVQKISAKLGKKAILSVVGDAHLDVEVLRKLHQCFVHLINNAVDHGIEMPETRKQLSKIETGLLQLECRQEGRDVVLRFADDGKGIDVEAARQRIASREGLTPAEASALSRENVLGRLFENGFTTRDQVSETSGRGVGLDVVKDILSQLEGSVVIETAQGEGTSFLMRFPLRIASPSRQFMLEDKNG